MCIFLLTLCSCGQKATDISNAPQPTEFPKHVLKSRDSAQSYSDWKLSGKTPEDFFHLDLTESQRCSILENLEPQQLAVFDTAIEEHRNLISSCQVFLSERLYTYWEGLKNEFHKQLALRGLKSSYPSKKVPFTQETISTKKINLSEKPAIYNTANLPEGHFALTFDDGPHRTRTDQILNALESYKTNATFFLVGRSANNWQHVVKRELNEGHGIGTHSYSHPLLSSLNKDEAIENILKGQRVVSSIAGPTSLFRFPYFEHPEPLAHELLAHGFSLFYGNIDSLDWKLPEPIKIYENLIHQIETQRRGIIVFHDPHQETVIVLPELLAEMARRGHTLVSFHSNKNL